MEDSNSTKAENLESRHAIRADGMALRPRKTLGINSLTISSIEMMTANALTSGTVLEPKEELSLARLESVREYNIRSAVLSKIKGLV